MNTGRDDRGRDDRDRGRDGDGRDRDDRGRGVPPWRRRMRKFDWFEQNKVEPDYKDFKIISRYVTERGKIVPRRLSGVNARNQRKLAIAIKRARHLALLPFVAENIK